jgi:hypothetical protein
MDSHPCAKNAQEWGTRLQLKILNVCQAVQGVIVRNYDLCTDPQVGAENRGREAGARGGF